MANQAKKAVEQVLPSDVTGVTEIGAEVDEKASTAQDRLDAVRSNSDRRDRAKAIKLLGLVTGSYLRLEAVEGHTTADHKRTFVIDAEGSVEPSSLHDGEIQVLIQRDFRGSHEMIAELLRKMADWLIDTPDLIELTEDRWCDLREYAWDRSRGELVDAHIDWDSVQKH